MKNELKKYNTEFVIIGAGTIGLFLFNELKKLNKSVLLIEKGSRQASINKAKDILSEGKVHSGTFLKRAFGVGGNSTLWGGQLVEFLDNNVNQYDDNFGLKKNELHRLYNELYRIFNINKVTAQEFLKKEKIKINHREIKFFFSNWLKEPNFANYYKNIIDRNKSDIFLKANIKKINLKKNNINSLEIFHDNENKLVLTQNCIITIGTVETIKFFLKNKHLTNSKNLIGKYFQDHIGIHIGDVKILNKKNFFKFFFNGYINKSKYQPKLFYKEINNNHSLGASGEFKFFSKYHRKIVELKKNLIGFIKYKKFSYFFEIIKLSLILNFKIMSLLYSFVTSKKIRPFYDKGIKFYIQSEQIPIKNSCIRFDKKKNKFILSWKIDGRELGFIKNFAIKTDKFLQENKIAKINLKKFLNYSEKKFKNELRDTNHPAGGLVLSKKKNERIVNNDFSVEGTRNLYVIGNCLYRKSSFANITFTTLALALKFVKSVKKKNV